MDDEVILASIALMLSASFLLIKKKQKRRFGVHPINRKRAEFGMFNTLIKAMLEQDEKKFVKYTRLTISQFSELLRLTRSKLTKNRSRKAIPAAHRLVLTLHFLSSECSMQEIAYGHYLGLTTVSNIIKETSKIIWETLQPIVMSQPNKDQWSKISQEFYERWNMPNCCGAIDGKHVNIRCPANSGSQFFNYKKTHSIVLMAACDANYKFTCVDVGAAGGSHDSVVFQQSGFGYAVLKGNIDFPEDKYLPGSANKLPHFFVADAAFPLHKHIMRPYPGKALQDEKLIFNYRLSRARRTIENAFGILVQRWQQLKRTLNGHVDTCEYIVLACVVLHNYVQKDHQLPVSQTKNDKNHNNNPSGLKSVSQLGSNNAKRNYFQNRELLCHYLNSNEGAVPWQLEKIYAGSVPPRFSFSL